MVALAGEDLEGHVEQLAAAADGGQAGGHGLPHGNNPRGRQERSPPAANCYVVRPSRLLPDPYSRRPAEPLRPTSVSRKATVGLLAVQARRARFRVRSL